ncbi:UDP-glucosyltransferase 29-like [Rhododendron vialii]|uniref:UDP-glucosyltransferase 29-like n=1 Tax=Rhododendron vialii TaxID=182163 RepID=UPI00266001FE|nr:UDP-glucosyltransferase 29-like [Rhododendron vialii]
METIKGSISVLMLPWLAHGHISPFLELAKRLTEKSFYIYFCSTHVNLISVKKILPEKYSQSIELVELHLPSSPELPPHLHTTNGLPSHLMPILKTAFEKSKPFFSHILNTLKPDLIMYDFNEPWVPAAAWPLNIPAVLFLTFGSAFTSYFQNVLENPDTEFPFQSIYLHECEKATFQKMSEFSADGLKDTDLFLESIKQSQDVILIKTSGEIEGKYVDYLSKLAKKKVQPVGPLVQEIDDRDEDIEVMRFLRKKDESSVVFVAFGSEYFLSNEEREEIAHGLELSRVNFIWVIRFPVGEKTRVEDALPKGFLDRVGGSGMVVEGWAPQAKILGHSSTGGFVSHCGWSSLLESIKFGVPIIAMPMHLDQPFNARLVDEVGVGMEVKRDETGRLDREEIARVITSIVVKENGTKFRNKARELSENITMKEVEEIDGVVEEVVQLCGKRK